MRNINKAISLIVAVAFVLTLFMPGVAHAVIVQDPRGREVELPEFEDTKGHWAEKVINQWQYYEIVKGVGKKEFKPNEYVTRRDFAVVIDRLFKFYELGVNSFKDLELDQYYTLPMLRLHAAGIMYGDGENIRPHSYITREEAVTMLCRAFGIDTINVTTGFKDDSSISPWAYPSVATFKSYGYVAGYNGFFNPKGNLTRAEMITIIDRLISAYYKETGRYTNVYKGNGFISTGGVVIRNSNIDGNIYIVHGARSGQVNIENSIVNGKVIVQAADSRVIFTGETSVDEVEVKANNVSIVGSDIPDRIVVSDKVKGVTLDKVPKYLLLKGKSSAVIDGVEFENDGSTEIRYRGDKLVKEIVNKKGTVVGGPKIILSSISITVDNNVTIGPIQLRDEGDSDIKEIGIIYNKSSEVPDIEDYDVKKQFKGNEADYASFTINVDGQTDGAVWTYRAYAINGSGKIGYSDPKSIQAYSFDVQGNVVDTRILKNSDGTISGVEKTFEVFIKGSKIPNITRVVALSNLNNGIDEPYRETAATLTRSYVSTDYKKLSYKSKQRFNATKDGNVYPDKYYGYRIEFTDGTIIEKFPVFTDYSKLPDDIKRIETGTARFIGSRVLSISNNIFEEGSGIPVELGVVILEKSPSDPAPTYVNPDDDWQKYPYYTGYGSWKSPYYVNIDISGSQNIVYYYAAYVKTTTKTTYGQIRRIISPSPPVYLGVKNITLGNQKTNAIVELNVLSSLPLYTAAGDGIASFVKESDGTPVKAYNNKPLSVAGAQFSGEVLKLTFTGLEPGQRYIVVLHLGNARGVTKVSFEISTE